ncbi:hypothetical protein [Prosthecobacter vanneervenii]|uniref:Uncharacterized protein n=1 Tax=Prosthecobacter vanneervenii TaxID=48466 RepID=A0A7W7Y7I6_9BACT|nr:hypothetical protein [Prosthecobacter vanneervenii]MBB5030867.1 hypothetical protein [Prosthecobacter vanneervenii]
MKGNQPARFEGQDHTLWSFTDHVLVECSNCGQSASVYRSDGAHPAGEVTEYRLECTHCGALKAASYAQDMLTSDPAMWQGFRLWLQTRCKGRVFWALNAQHLDYIRSYIVADLRPREKKTAPDPKVRQVLKPQSHGYHLTSRLPRWMVLKTSRQHVLRAIALLRVRHDKTKLRTSK